jgi:hypothetical protein
MYLRVALVGAILALLTGCGAVPQAPSVSTPQAVLHLKVPDGVTPVAALPQSIVSLAEQQGSFRTEGLDIEIEDVNARSATLNEFIDVA